MAKEWEKKDEQGTSVIEMMNLDVEMDEKAGSWKCTKCEKTLKTGVMCGKCGEWTHFICAKPEGMKKASKTYYNSRPYLCLNCVIKKTKKETSEGDVDESVEEESTRREKQEEEDVTKEDTTKEADTSSSSTIPESPSTDTIDHESDEKSDGDVQAVQQAGEEMRANAELDMVEKLKEEKKEKEKEIKSMKKEAVHLKEKLEEVANQLNEEKQRRMLGEDFNRQLMKLNEMLLLKIEEMERKSNHSKAGRNEEYDDEEQVCQIFQTRV